MEERRVRRRFSENTGIVVPPSLQSLPPELQHSIMKRICEDGFKNFWRAKSTCKALRDVSDTPEFHRSVDVYLMEAPNWPVPGVTRFKDLCLHHGNPTALFSKGCYDFFKQGELELGLEEIRLSAVGGYELGCYAYALIHRILNPQVMILNGFGLVSKEFARQMRVVVDFLPDVAWPMYDHRPPLYDEMVNLIPTDEIYSCRCSQNSRYARPWFEECKTGPMCDSCFWICQAEWFSREFPRKVLTWPDQHFVMNPQIMF